MMLPERELYSVETAVQAVIDEHQWLERSRGCANDIFLITASFAHTILMGGARTV